MTNIAMERSTIFKNGKPSIDGPCSMAMLNNQRVDRYYSEYSYLFALKKYIELHAQRKVHVVETAPWFCLKNQSDELSNSSPLSFCLY